MPNKPLNGTAYRRPLAWAFGRNDKMKPLLIALSLLISDIAKGDDLISNLVLRLNSEIGGLWINGVQPRYNIESNDTPKAVVAKIAKAWRICDITNTSRQIHEIRNVQINGPIGDWKAVLIDCDTGMNVLLFSRLEGGGWWARFYDGEEIRGRTRQ